ncbi:MAG: nucleotide exchange factor GrpE [Alphaproteobacteria bacterium]|nr:nucleotide exchange factor GrpE [Alphaproteobacteria bacterium]
MSIDNEKIEELDDKTEIEESNVEDEVPAEEESVEDKEAKVLEKLMEENARLKDDYLRAFAEAENTKKRCQQEIEKNNKFAIADFAKNLLGVADNLQRAIDAASKEEDNPACESLLKGVELTQHELTKVFDRFKVHKMDIIGTIFDPNFHQVIQEVPDTSKPAGTIVAEVQTGYMIGDRILREAMVVVTKA